MTVRVPLMINSLLGLHARPSAALVRTVSEFSCSTQVSDGRDTVNGKSIMGLMMLALDLGSVVEVACDGPDAVQAVATLSDLADFGFRDYFDRVDDIYSTWQFVEKYARPSFLLRLNKFTTKTGRLEFDRLAIDALPKGYGSTKTGPELLAVIEGIHILDESYVSSHNLSPKQCADVVGGAPFIVYGRQNAFCACVDMINTNRASVTAPILHNAFLEAAWRGRFFAIAFELLSRRGPMFSNERIAIAQQSNDPLSIAALLRSLGRSKQIYEFVLAVVDNCDEAFLAGLARSAACALGQKELLRRILKRSAAHPSPFVRHCLADASVCMYGKSPKRSLQVIRHLLADSEPHVRWRATNALRKIQLFAGRRAGDLLKTSSRDSAPLVNYEARRDMYRWMRQM